MPESRPDEPPQHASCCSSSRSSSSTCIAFFVVPPFDPLAAEGVDAECVYPICFINGTLELPAPHTVFPAGHHAPPGLVVFDVSISNTLLTLWIVAVVVIVRVLVHGPRADDGPGRPPERRRVDLRDRSRTSPCRSAGPGAKPYIPLFAAFFLLILFSNWSRPDPRRRAGDLVPRPHQRRQRHHRPRARARSCSSSIQGFKHLGLGYLGKFFPLGEFRKGIGAGVIALFVGLVELLLEFVKPVTLSMRLFGNIYGGEVALGVLTALTVALIPLAMYALEVMLNLVQALIFSTLTLMFTLAAIEHHGDEHDESARAHVHAHRPGGHRRGPLIT